MSIRRPSTLAGQAIASGRPVVLGDAAHQTEIVHAPVANVLEVGPAMAMPLVG